MDQPVTKTEMDQWWEWIQDIPLIDPFDAPTKLTIETDACEIEWLHE